MRGYIIMVEESGLEMAASLESVNPIELNEHWNEEIIMMEESGLEMDVGNARPASLESVNPIELNEHWNEEIALSFKQYLVCGRYPDVLPREKRRNFRKRAKDFEVMDGKLYYKRSGNLRLALYRIDDCLHTFEVRL